MERMREDPDSTEAIWVETTPQILNYFCRGGVGKSEYFDYQGTRVCEFGKSEIIQKRLDRQVGAINHGDDEGTVKQVTGTKRSSLAPV